MTYIDVKTVLMCGVVGVAGIGGVVGQAAYGTALVAGEGLVNTIKGDPPRYSRHHAYPDSQV